MFLRTSSRLRRGFSTVQWVLIAAVVVVVVIASVQLVGRESSARLEGTAGGISDPSELKRFLK